MGTALQQYILENQQMFYRMAYSYCKNQQDALDIVQESICKAIRQEKSLKDSAAMKPWFCKIILNNAIDFQRKRKKVVYLSEQELPDAGTEPEYTDFDLQKALEELPEKYKAVVMLRYFEDMKLEEIAQVLDENVNSVKTRLYTALKKLRVTLEPALQE